MSRIAICDKTSRHLFISIEIKSRELLSKLLLSRHALLEFDSVVIGRTRNVLEFALSEGRRGDFFIHKGGLQYKWVIALKQRGIIFCILDEELSPSGAARQFAAKRVAPGIAPLVDLFLASDDSYASIIADEHAVLAERIRVVGFLRFNLLASNVIEQLARYYAVDTLDKKILICSGFGYTSRHQVISRVVVEFNYLSRTLYQRVRAMDWRQVRFIYQDVQIFSERVRVTIRAFSQAKRFAKDLSGFCGKIAELSVVLRPHPAEDQRLWFRVADGIDNLTVRYDLPLEVELCQASKVIHLGSTTAIQACVRGVSGISLAGIYPVRGFNDADRLSTIPADLDQLIAQVLDTTLLQASTACSDLAETEVSGRIISELSAIANDPSLAIKQDQDCERINEVGPLKNPKITFAGLILSLLRIGQTQPRESQLSFEDVESGLEALFGQNLGLCVEASKGCYVLKVDSAVE